MILHAYAKWGEGCPDKLLGDWVMALWDPRRRSLFLARGHFGQTGLYYYRDADHLAFATSLRGLFALPFVPRRMNRRMFVSFMTVWFNVTNKMETAYRDILKLPGPRPDRDRRWTSAPAVLAHGRYAGSSFPVGPGISGSLSR
ncbi:MAG: hypothetical protein HQK57_07860 [Deltaproteobacteria bacterium]|nr:hypothetical protein [Deltaproteobacteria bacterium]MBF0525464.1 hypothetical protein [Deltaproteobacteria bacterium]